MYLIAKGRKAALLLDEVTSAPSQLGKHEPSGPGCTVQYVAENSICMIIQSRYFSTAHTPGFCQHGLGQKALLLESVSAVSRRFKSRGVMQIFPTCR